MAASQNDITELHYEVKPRWRGRLHAGAALAALTLTVVFLPKHPYSLTWATLLLYCASVTEMYSFSAIFHLGTWRETTYQKLLAVDQAGIFVFISSTTTLLILNLLGGVYRYILVALLWLLTLSSIIYIIHLLQRAPRWLSPLLCIILAMPTILILPALSSISLIGTGLLLGSALCQGSGAYIYTRCEPDLLPGIFGYHELFHLLTIIGTVATTIVIYIWIA